MNEVSDEFLLAALRMVEYLEESEMDDYKYLEENGVNTDGHIYLSVNKVRTDLLNMNISSSPECEEQAKKLREEILKTLAD